jgi:ABC-type transport system involved in multi-copper enzyme maturation permease subunit
MYLWKCWRDTRSFFIALLVIVGAQVPITAVVYGGASLGEEFGKTFLFPMFPNMLQFTALGLGALCAVEEFSEETTQFLLTKPRPRAYFVWSSWVTGFVELVTIALVYLSAGWLTVACCAKSHFSSAFFGSLKEQGIIAIIIFVLLNYCLIFFLTVLLRGGMKGLGATMGIVLVLQATAVRQRWHRGLPTPDDPFVGLPMAVSNIVWILVSLLLVFAAQIVIERTEI